MGDNMQEFIVYNDIHKFSDYEMPLKEEYGAIYNGDIFELRSCKRSDVAMIEREMAEFESRVGDRFLFGNHEMNVDRMHDRLVIGNIVFCHGHTVFWTMKKCIKFMSKRKGKGAFGRALSAMLDQYRHLKPFYLSKKQLNRCMDLCIETNTDILIAGHKHPSNVETTYFTRDNKSIKIICLPRGRNEITV